MSRERSEILANMESEQITREDKRLFRKSWELSRAIHGNELTFYLPGMIRYGRERGRYPAISITGDRCQLMCEHCMGKLLEPMIKISQPVELVNKCSKLSKSGCLGILLSGGSDPAGRLPWAKYFDALREVRDKTSLFLSAHTGFPDRETCLQLKDSGVNQALIDVMGDDETASRIYHLEGLKPVLKALEGIAESGLQLIPHIVVGLFYGNMRAEYQALEIIRDYRPNALVIVVLTPLKGTPMSHIKPTAPIQVARLIAKARLMMPNTPISLGCERPRNKAGRLLESLALQAGVNRIAIWSDQAIKEARSLGLDLRFQPTCCSLPTRRDFCFRDNLSF
ncbi:MAG: radical SAM protein [Pseudomonadota bacterium]